jgi:hypothetical protein
LLADSVLRAGVVRLAFLSSQGSRALWQEKATGELIEMLEARPKYDEFNELPLIVLPD